MIFSYLLNMQSHPSWVCGLKHVNRCGGTCVRLSHPSWVCGLKRDDNVIFRKYDKSHPSWVCGLKLNIVHTVFSNLLTIKGGER